MSENKSGKMNQAYTGSKSNNYETNTYLILPYRK